MKTCFAKRLGASALAIADLCDYYEQGYLITRINVPAAHRRLGVGTELLKEITAEADAHGEWLWLEVASSDGPDNSALAEWYRRHGFRGNSTGFMSRRPQQRKASQ